MGKLTVAEADDLQKKNIISAKLRTQMETEGVVSSKRTTINYSFKTADGKFVTPRLYFEGGSNTTWSKKMTEFHNRVTELIREYGTETKTKTKKG